MPPSRAVCHVLDFLDVHVCEGSRSRMFMFMFSNVNVCECLCFRTFMFVSVCVSNYHVFHANVHTVLFRNNLLQYFEVISHQIVTFILCGLETLRG